MTSQGVKFLCDFRSDVLVAMKMKNISTEDRSALKTMSSHLKDLLSHWFSAGLLELEQITWQSSCAMLQKISDYEAVHPIKNWTDLKVSEIFLCFWCFSLYIFREIKWFSDRVEKYSETRSRSFFREINSLVTSMEDPPICRRRSFSSCPFTLTLFWQTLLSRNFCQKCMRINFFISTAV